MKRKHSGDSRKVPFQQAIRASIEDLLRCGSKVTKQAVIDNARFSDGRPVGKATLYSRHEKTDELVHADLHREIDEAARRQAVTQRGLKVVTPKNDTLAMLRESVRELKKENAQLRDQLVAQEARLHIEGNSHEGYKHKLSAQEESLYVLAKLLNVLTDESIGDFREVVSIFEKKYRGETEKMTRLESQVGAYRKDISYSRLVRFDPSKRGAKV